MSTDLILCLFFLTTLMGVDNLCRQGGYNLQEEYKCGYMHSHVCVFTRTHNYNLGYKSGAAGACPRGLLWLLGFLAFGMGCGGLLVVVAFDVGKGVDPSPSRLC